jgi:uncharacterized secreted protein with C-terminal beta-propeller domain
MDTSPASSFNRTERAVFSLAVVLVAAFVAAFSLGTVAPVFNQGATSQGLSSFQSYSQLEAFMAANAKSAQQYARQGYRLGGIVPVFFGGFGQLRSDVASAATDNAPSSITYTGTNVQVQGVDEPDSVKTNGTLLFVSSGNAVSIIDAYPASTMHAVSSLAFQGGAVLGIEITQNRLLVLEQRNANETYIDLLLYDTSNLASPSLIRNMSIAGSYVAARLAQGYAYAVVQQPSYTFGSNGNATGVLPVITEGGVTSSLNPGAVYYSRGSAQISYYTFVVSLAMDSGSTKATSILTGPSSTVYVSQSNIYVAYTNYIDYYADSIPGNIFTGGVISSLNVQQAQNSTIVRAAYSAGTVTVAASGTVPGTVLNQFSLDEYQGYFRVATSRFATFGGTNTKSDDVYVLSSNMSQISALTNIAPGENIYAVRFVGDMGYVVTFEQIDPLFVISFRDVSNPQILSALKVTGYSDYLHPLPGGYLIGVGKDAVPSSTGNFAWYLGLKLSLFRVFDNGTSTQIAKYLIGDRGTDSSVLNDHLAFTYDSSRNLTVIPVLLAKVSGNQSYDPNSPPPYGDLVWQGVYLLKVTPSGFEYVGRVSQYPAGQNYGDSPNNGLQIDRSVIIGQGLYTVSQTEVMASDLSNLSAIATVKLLS